MKARGIKLSTRVVGDDPKPGHPFFATRAYFMFKAFGHKNVSVLNGGMTKWIAEARPVASEENIGSEEDYAYKLNAEIISNFEQITSLEKEIGEGKSDA